MGFLLRVMPQLDIRDEIKVFEEGVVDLLSRDELEKKIALSLKTQKPLRIKYGADPSSPDLHLGHTVPLRKLRALQKLGHQIVFLVGDFNGPSLCLVVRTRVFLLYEKV